METMVVPYAVRSYTVIVHEAEEGGYWGEVLELPGCVSQGETLEELQDNIKEAIDAVLESRSQEFLAEFFTEPIIAEQGFIDLSTLRSYCSGSDSVQQPDTWTVTA